MTTEEQIVEILLKNHMTVSTAESCTGGLVAAGLVNVPGVSGAFREGYITYANEAKSRILGVQESTLAQYGAVSSQTAKEMARGAARAAGAQCSVVTTGIAGPDGGTPEKPVGLVYIGCCIGEETWVRKCMFPGDRLAVRSSAAQAALELLLEHLQAYARKIHR